MITDLELFAAKHYVQPCLSVEQFREDLNRLSHIKRLFTRYTVKGELSERLILNHLIVFHNSFATQAATEMCFYKMSSEQHAALKTFLLFLNFLPEGAFPDVEIDINIATRLNNI